jgi:phospho-N-acetylmuramoyl-pentapeptide-transferase
MIYFLSSYLHRILGPGFSFLRLADYLSVRAIAAALTGIVLTLLLTPRLIRYLYRRRIVDEVRITGVPSAQDKKGTPTLGGIVLVACVLASSLLWCDLANRYVLVTLLGFLWFAGIGLIDDLAKWRGRSGARGLSEASKLFLQGLFALLLVTLLASPWSPLPPRESGTFYVPFLKHALFDSLWLYLPIVVAFVFFVGNSVNITDGMDGLAIVPSVFAVGVLGVFAYIMGNAVWSKYLQYPSLPGTGELMIFGAAFAGAGIGFLWYNSYPAQIIMGDAGSLAIGGAMATISVLVKQEALFVILGGLFIAEALSSQLQDKLWVKVIGRRLFYRAPLHHQLEYVGLAETKVVIRLWIVAGILALASIATIKLR